MINQPMFAGGKYYFPVNCYFKCEVKDKKGIGTGQFVECDDITKEAALGIHSMGVPEEITVVYDGKTFTIGGDIDLTFFTKAHRQYFYLIKNDPEKPAFEVYAEKPWINDNK